MAKNDTAPAEGTQNPEVNPGLQLVAPTPETEPSNSVLVVYKAAGPWDRRLLSKADVEMIAGPGATSTKMPLVWEQENLHRINIVDGNEALMEFFKGDPAFEIK